jgi:pyruvate dehydrogenase E2 component (dihydrolipoamide acetyltransferase)
MPDVAMPRLSDSMEEGTILKWLKSDGDEVEQGEELCEIETDKANMTYEADQAGVLKIVAQEGDTLAVGETIATIGEGSGGGSDDEAADEDEPEAEADEEPESDADEAEDENEDEADEEQPEDDAGDAQDEEAKDEEPEPVEASGDGDEEGEDEPSDGGGNGRVKASPVAKRMARELGLELSDVEGSGPGGRIVKADVEAAAERGGTKTEEAADEPEEPAAEEQQEATEETEAAPAKATAGDGGTAKGEVTTEDLTRLQQTVARRMAESKATAPEFVMTVEVEMDAAVELRAQIKAAAAEDEPVPSFNDLVVKACALALRDFPRANGAYRDGKFELYSRVNVGVAVAGMDALVVPTVFDADRKSLGTIAREAKGLAERVREGKISPPELAGGTFTVSNLGMFGIRRFVAVINPPQAAILAVGEMRPTPVVRGGKLTVRSVMEITLSCDHRILYGADAAAFLAKIRERLERPYSLTL